jgi:O-acetyl-ADP-ribose deacetylase (regulator of RNase III)
MKTSVGKTKVEVASGDITQLEVDAIATLSSTRLEMDHGVGAVIKAAGGEAIEVEAMLQGPIEVGEAVATTGHDLKARWVIHVALTEGTPQTDAGKIAKATRAALECAVRCQARSVALPAFGTGACAFPRQQCSSIMVSETVRYLRAHRSTPLRHVMFCVYDDVARSAFQHALAGASRF